MPVDIIRNPILLGANLKKLRIIRDITMEQAANGAGLTKGFLSLVERGQRNIKFLDLRKLLNVYGYSTARFISKIQDSSDDTVYEPECLVQGNSHSILLDGCRDEGKYHLYLLRPLRYDNDIELLELYLPQNSQMTEEMITVNTEIRGVVQRGKLLIVFEKDEFVVKEREEFCFDGRIPHIYRNYTNQPVLVNLIILPGEF